jgi:hypothetical protein
LGCESRLLRLSLLSLAKKGPAAVKLGRKGGVGRSAVALELRISPREGPE